MSSREVQWSVSIAGRCHDELRASRKQRFGPARSGCLRERTLSKCSKPSWEKLSGSRARLLRRWLIEVDPLSFTDDSSERVFSCKGNDHFSGTGRVPVDQENNPSMERLISEALRSQGRSESFSQAQAHSVTRATLKGRNIRTAPTATKTTRPSITI